MIRQRIIIVYFSFFFSFFLLFFLFNEHYICWMYAQVCTYFTRSRSRLSLDFQFSVYIKYTMVIMETRITSIFYFFSNKKNEKISIHIQTNLISTFFTSIKSIRSIINRWTESNQRFGSFHSNQYGGIAICDLFTKSEWEKEKIVREKERERERKKIVFVI